MLVEAKKKFTHGFLLSEADLRRTIEVVTEQYQKLADSPDPTVCYEMKYKNGAISKTELLDDVFNQENLGSAEIIKLKISFNAEVENESVKIMLEYINADLDEEPGIISVWYNISGTSRDWVFVTSTLIRERIEKIKRFCPNEFLGSSTKGKNPLTSVIFPVLFAMVLVFLMFFVIVNVESNREDISILISQAKETGKIKDAIDALILIEEAREQRISTLGPTLLDPLTHIFVWLIAGLVIISAFVMFLFRYYLVYNFLWGDYLEYFKKYEGRLKLVLIVFFVGIIVSFLGGILANMVDIS